MRLNRAVFGFTADRRTAMRLGTPLNKRVGRANRNCIDCSGASEKCPKNPALFMRPKSHFEAFCAQGAKQAPKTPKAASGNPGRPSHTNKRCEFRPPRCPPPDWQTCGYRRRGTMTNTDDPSRFPREYTTPLPLFSAAAALVVFSLSGT